MGSSEGPQIRDRLNCFGVKASTDSIGIYIKVFIYKVKIRRDIRKWALRTWRDISITKITSWMIYTPLDKQI